jgi:hypothetical protein
VTTSTDNEEQSSWSPGDVWVMGADGELPVQLTDTPVIEESPDWQPLPFDAASPAEDRLACGDLSLVPGGVASVVSVEQGCGVALDVAGEWQAGARLGARPERVRGFDCAHERHSFDQVLVECDHRGVKKGVAFVYRDLP